MVSAMQGMATTASYVRFAPYVKLTLSSHRLAFDRIRQHVSSWPDWSQTLPFCIAAQRLTTKCQHVASASIADGYQIQGGELNLQGCTPFMLACSNGHGEVVKALLEAGADASASNPVMFLLY